MKNNNSNEKKARYLTKAYKAILEAQSMDADEKIETMKKLVGEAESDMSEMSEEDWFDENESIMAYEENGGDYEEEQEDCYENDVDDGVYHRSVSDVVQDSLFHVVETVGDGIDGLLERFINLFG